MKPAASTTHSALSLCSLCSRKQEDSRSFRVPSASVANRIGFIVGVAQANSVLIDVEEVVADEN
jgi:hypothetical protein